MKREPLEKSKIRVEEAMDSTSYIWENKERGIFGYALAPMLFLWLCGWTYGGINTIKNFMNELSPLGERLDTLNSLIGWAIGEVFVIGILYFILRPLKPSKLTLSTGYVEYKTGNRPFDIIAALRNKSGRLLALFKGLRNKTYKIKLTELENLRLERTDERQRLCCVAGEKTIEIGETLSEPEREWIYEILKEHR